MLDKDIIEQLKSIFGNLKSDIVFLLQQSDNESMSMRVAGEGFISSGYRLRRQNL